jgi:uncharacterized delta-60 repeat protein
VAPGADDRLKRLVPQASGKIVAIGTAYGTPTQIAAIRFSATGQLDTSFNGGTGKTLSTFAAGLTGDDGAAQSNGAVVIAGLTVSGGVDSVGLTRLGVDGTIDTGFGTGGLVSLVQPTRAWASSVAIQPPDDKIVVGGLIRDLTGYYDFNVARLESSGVPDPAFGAGGFVQTAIGTGDDQISRIAIQADGAIVAAGSAIPITSSSNADYVLARYLGDPKPVAPLIPTSKISSPSKKTLKRKKFTKISGSAGPAGSIAKVEIAVRKIDSKSLKKKRCVWLKNNKAQFKKNKSTSKKKCTKQIWLKAKGTAKWSYSLKKNKYLPTGSYELYSRVTLTNGVKQTSFTTKAGNFRKLKLTK